MLLLLCCHRIGSYKSQYYVHTYLYRFMAVSFKGPGAAARRALFPFRRTSSTAPAQMLRQRETVEDNLPVSFATCSRTGATYGSHISVATLENYRIIYACLCMPRDKRRGTSRIA